jgi:hypothetical protein
MAITKINKKQLAEAVEVAVKKVLLESNHFTAMRNIEHLANSTSMEFEKNIVDALGLMNPDHMQPDVQQKYFQIVSSMKEGIKSSIMDAAKQLVSFPRADDGKGGVK